MFSVNILGTELPDFTLFIAIAVLVFGFLLVSKASPRITRTGGRGQMWRCPRCGTDFQKEKVQYMESGQENVYFDDRCPNCGWDYDWGDPDKKRR